jgi:phospholipid/cholesterol/gamma-HCH transport system substrate-binding protein
MRSNRTLEIGTGLFVLLGFAALFFLTTQLPGSKLKFERGEGYTVTAAFDNIGDLRDGAPVSMSGVRIGEVTGIGFDPNDFRAIVTMRIQPEFSRIPEDSDASIQTQGLLGGKYVGISPGGAESYLQEGSRMEFTQSAIVLENLVNKFFANMAGGRNQQEAGPAPAEAEEGKTP